MDELRADELQKEWFFYQCLRYVLGCTHNEAAQLMRQAKRDNAKEME